jgi:hypothetical protein
MATFPELLPGLLEQHGHPAPLLILAPTTRCGSTLLQRAVNGAKQAIIYGENFIFMEGAPMLLGGQLSDIDVKSRAAAASLDAFLNGDRAIDGSGLFPDYGAYRKQLLSLFYQIADFYRRESSKQGYARWGLKHQIANLAGFNNFVQMVPGFRSVTVFRDAVDVAKSMQTRWPENLATEAQCFEIGKRWRENLAYLLRLDRARNLVIRYEDLVARPDEFIPRLESHFGLALSREAFQKKVNVHTFDAATGKAGEAYRPPSDLPGEKLRALLEGAQPLYGRLGYTQHA